MKDNDNKEARKNDLRIVEVQHDDELTDMLKCSMVGEVVRKDLLKILQVLCGTEGIQNFQIKYLGGTEILMVLENEKTLVNFLSNENHGIWRWLKNLWRWSEDFRPTGRLTW